MIYEDYLKETQRDIERIIEEKGHVIIAIDGRCASGKSTYAAKLQEVLGASLIHMDDFFLQPYQRTAERYNGIGENVDHERFLTEVLQPLHQQVSFSYRPFRCSTMTFADPITIHPGAVTIIEGSYSMRPELCPYYDWRIFMSVDAEEQIKRIQVRSYAKVQDFITKWIPYEEKYFKQMHIQETSDQVIDTTGLF